jgi:hypothetical protein
MFNSLTESMLSQSIKRRIRGNLPKKRDVVDWSQDKIRQFLKFIVFFTDGEGFILTKEKWDVAEKSDEKFWEEFMLRIDCIPGQKKFATRFISQQRIVLTWIKENPHAITEDMYKLCLTSPRLSWAVSHFKTVTTELGVEVIERDLDERTNPNQLNAVPQSNKTPQAIYEEGLLSMTTLFRQLARSVPSSEIKSMKPEQRVALTNQLAKTLRESFRKFKPNVAVFNNIN